jgi:DNA-binding transcriptional LysR family regulator
MAFQPASFLLGLGAAWVMPLVARAFRPMAVQLTAAGMTVFDETRRMVAEQMEAFEDIAAEARARREEMIAAASAEADGADGPVAEDRARRRGNGARRRVS